MIIICCCRFGVFQIINESSIQENNDVEPSEKETKERGNMSTCQQPVVKESYYQRRSHEKSSRQIRLRTLVSVAASVAERLV